MSKRSLEELLAATQFTDNPSEALFAIAKSLRDKGLSQVQLYGVFRELYMRHQDDDDEKFYDSILDVCDCIWCGGWGKDRELFDTPLTDELVGNRGNDQDEAKPGS